MYSQYSEDDVFVPLLGDKPGKLLEIGAWDPIQFSNSRALIERGWSAVLIECSPWPLAKLIEEYGGNPSKLIEEYGGNPKVTIIAAAVSLETGLVPIHVTADAVSTSNEAAYLTWAKDGGYRGMLHVPAITIPQILNQFGSFDFVSIDTEGTSVDLALAWLAAKQEPKVLVVEHDGRVTELCSRAPKYRAEVINDTNVVLVRR